MFLFSLGILRCSSFTMRYSILRNSYDTSRTIFKRSAWNFLRYQSLKNWLGTPRYTTPSSHILTMKLFRNHVLKLAGEMESSTCVSMYSQSSRGFPLSIVLGVYAYRSEEH